MNCINCGNEIYVSGKPCKHCGYINKGVDTTPIIVKHEEKQSYVAESYSNIVVISIVLILCVFILPMFNRGIIGAELMPNDRSIYFEKTLDIFLEENNPFDYPVVCFTFISLVAGVFLFIGSIAKNKVLSALSSGVGALFMIITLIRLISRTDWDSVMSFSNTHLGVGFWVALILLIVGFFSSMSKAR